MVNWVGIKKRYLQGERPADIAKSCRGVTARQINAKVAKGGWRAEKLAVLDQAKDSALEDLMRFRMIGLEIALKLLENLLENTAALGPFWVDKVTFNPLTKAALTESLKLLDEKKENQLGHHGPLFINLPGVNLDAI